jgi:hypothetical protein
MNKKWKTNLDYPEAEYNQHGDVLLFKEEKLPAGVELEKSRSGKSVVAEGEVTGHMHVLDAAGTDIYKAQDGTRYLEVKEDSPLTHEEHKTQTLSPGVYRIDAVREVDHFDKSIRSVRD